MIVRNVYVVGKLITEYQHFGNYCNLDKPIRYSDILLGKRISSQVQVLKNPHGQDGCGSKNSSRNSTGCRSGNSPLIP